MSPRLLCKIYKTIRLCKKIYMFCASRLEMGIRHFDTHCKGAWRSELQWFICNLLGTSYKMSTNHVKIYTIQTKFNGFGCIFCKKIQCCQCGPRCLAISKANSAWPSWTYLIFPSTSVYLGLMTST